MVTNFETITADLNDEELVILPVIIKAFSKYTKDNPIKAPQIIASVNSNSEKFGLKKKFSEPKLRRLCNYIRTQSLLPLIATSSGYFVDYDKQIIQSQIKSLNERASSIHGTATGLSKFL
jgi:hypothetical protein